MLLYLDSGCGSGSGKALGEPDDSLALGVARAAVGLDLSRVVVWFSLFGGRIFLRKAFYFLQRNSWGPGLYSLVHNFRGVWIEDHQLGLSPSWWKALLHRLPRK